MSQQHAGAVLVEHLYRLGDARQIDAEELWTAWSSSMGPSPSGSMYQYKGCDSWGRPGGRSPAAAAGTDPDRALTCLDRAIPVFRDLGAGFWSGVSLVAAASLHVRHGEPREALPMFRDALDYWRLSGHSIQLWTTIRNIVELFARTGRDDAAVTMLAASETSATAPPAFGVHGDRLASVRDDLEARMGSAFESACERGRSMSDENVISHALAEIDEALAAGSTEPRDDLAHQ